jgi:hypothetical protein
MNLEKRIDVNKRGKANSDITIARFPIPHSAQRCAAQASAH